MSAPARIACDGGVGDRVGGGDRRVGEVVGDRDAREAELVAQQVGRDRARQRGGDGEVVDRVERVREHDRRDAGRDGGLERRPGRARAAASRSSPTLAGPSCVDWSAAPRPGKCLAAPNRRRRGRRGPRRRRSAATSSGSSEYTRAPRAEPDSSPTSTTGPSTPFTPRPRSVVAVSSRLGARLRGRARGRRATLGGGRPGSVLNSPPSWAVAPRAARGRAAARWPLASPASAASCAGSV